MRLQQEAVLLYVILSYGDRIPLPGYGVYQVKRMYVNGACRTG